MPIPSQAIIDTILADVNAVIPNFSSMVTSYRLLVGAAEEVHRTPGVPVDIYQRSIERFDRAGSIIDILLELLCCKISFSSDFLAVTCAPVDLFRLLSNGCEASDTPHHTAEQILQLEVLRRALERTRLGPRDSAFSCPPPEFVPPPVPAPPTTPGGHPPVGPSEISNEIAITVPVATVRNDSLSFEDQQPPASDSPPPSVSSDPKDSTVETPKRPLKQHRI